MSDRGLLFTGFDGCELNISCDNSDIYIIMKALLQYFETLLFNNLYMYQNYIFLIICI